MKPGDKAMLVSHGRWDGLLTIRPVTIKAVTPGGRISINEGSEKYRPDGSVVGDSPYSGAPKLRAWDDALWDHFQAEQANLAKVSKVWALLELLKRRTNNVKQHAETAALWDSLPESVRVLVDGKEGAK